MNKLFLSPNETINELGTKEEFEKTVCPECHRVFSPVDNRDCKTCLMQEAENRFGKFDEDGDDLLEDKLRAEYQEEMASDEDEEIKEMLEENGLDENDI